MTFIVFGINILHIWEVCQTMRESVTDRVREFSRCYSRSFSQKTKDIWTVGSFSKLGGHEDHSIFTSMLVWNARSFSRLQFIHLKTVHFPVHFQDRPFFHSESELPQIMLFEFEIMIYLSGAHSFIYGFWWWLLSFFT